MSPNWLFLARALHQSGVLSPPANCALLAVYSKSLARITFKAFERAAKGRPTDVKLQIKAG